MNDVSTGPFFVVGASRSGTALMRSVLNNHSDVMISGETHYFDDLRARVARFAQSPILPDMQHSAEDYFLALGHRPYGHQGNPERSELTREELTAVAERCGVGFDAYFEAFCQLQAQRAGKSIWGEKTPRHVFRIPEILDRYPTAQVICMVRDARAVVASYRDWRNQGGFDLEADPEHADALKLEEERAKNSYNLVLMSLLWRSAVNAAVSARDRFGDERIFVQQYEDLVGDPEGAMRVLVKWLGLEYTPALLDVPMHNSSFSRFDHRSGVSKEPMRRWREMLSDREVATIQCCCGSVMRRAGYELESVSVAVPLIWWEWTKLPFAALRAVVANRDRMGNMPQYVWRRMRLAMGKW